MLDPWGGREWNCDTDCVAHERHNSESVTGDLEMGVSINKSLKVKDVSYKVYHVSRNEIGLNATNHTSL